MKLATNLIKALCRPGILLLVYICIFSASIWLSFELRFDFALREPFVSQLLRGCLWIVPLKLLWLLPFGHFGGLLSYFSTPDLKRVLRAAAASSISILTVWYLVPHFTPPRGVILSDFVISTSGICALRFGLRTLRERYLGQRRPGAGTRYVAIVGAGDVGAQLACELLSKRWLSMHPVAFFDDQKKPGVAIHGIPVMGRPEALLDTKRDLKRKLRIQEVIIAMPSAPAKRVGEIVRVMQQLQIKAQTVPSMAQLATGQVKVSALRPVEIQDLLGRAAVQIDASNIQQVLTGRTVLVTGAGGSIGSELCRQIATFQPSQILLLERSEPALFAIEQELLERPDAPALVPLVGDLLDRSRLEQIFEQYQPEVIFHAAAHKHVPMMERQPAEAIKNNVVGTAQLASLAVEHGVDRFVLISTDKAINPTSVMGATKRLAEILLQSLQRGEGVTKFIAVRFGNVLGSSGSVVPIFNKQIAAGGPVKVTHQDVTRYFMTIPEATSLVLQSGAQGAGGEIFVLDMGSPVKIIDLARQMIELSGLRPYEDIDIAITGLRPGEKLYEELSHGGENLTSTHHPKIMRFISEPLKFDDVHAAIDDLVHCVDRAEPSRLKERLQDIIPEYRPFDSNGHLEARRHCTEELVQRLNDVAKQNGSTIVHDEALIRTELRSVWFATSRRLRSNNSRTAAYSVRNGEPGPAAI